MYNYCYSICCHIIFSFFVFSLCINTANASEVNALPFLPRLTISGGYGNISSQMDADGMIPLFGNNHGDMYADLSGQYGSDKTWSGSLGLGARQALNNQYLIGAYGFIDRDQTLDNHWLVFNPGVEMMTDHWDSRINGYFPVGSDRRISGRYFGDQIGLTNKEYFHDHSQYNGLYNKENVIGTGLDADVGYNFSNFKNLHIHGGGYYFTMPGYARNIMGEEAGLDLPVNKYIALSLDDSHDNVHHNTVLLTLKLSIGSGTFHHQNSDISDKLLAPVRRHFATLYNSSGIPESSSFFYTGRDHILEKNNLWFFTQNNGENFNASNGMSNCTYEHPCNGLSFNQNNINDIKMINPGANFYFNPGSYHLSDRLELNSNQSIYGRNEDYSLPASSQSGYPIFIGEGFDIKNANNINISNVSIEAVGTGIEVENSSNINIINNNININNGNGAFFRGINTDININNNQFNIHNGETGINIQSNDSGISGININHNIFNITNSNGAVFGLVAYSGNSVINLDDNTFNLNGSEFAAGIMSGGYGGTREINASHNIFNINAAGDNTANAYGLFIYSGTVNADHNQFNLHSSGNATGIQIYDIGSPATVNIKDNSFNFNALNSQHEENNGGIINDLGGNQWNNGLRLNIKGD